MPGALRFAATSLAAWSASRDAAEPHAAFSDGSASALYTHRSLQQASGGGGCWRPPAAPNAALPLADLPAAFDDQSVSLDYRKLEAVTPVQQQHPFGTCWAFSMVAATEGVMVVQGKQALQKLSEQMVVSCVPATYCGQDASRVWSYFHKKTAGRVQLETDYVYNRTCNFFREQQLAPDGTDDGYTGKCNLPGKPPYAPCPPCPGVTRRDGTPPCTLDVASATFSNAKVEGWGFVPLGSDGSSRRVVAALQKYGPAQIGIDASCLSGYTSGIVSNCTSANTDHAVTIVGAETDAASGLTYWIVKNSWNTTFGEEGYFRVARDTNPPQMGINGAYFGCYEEGCRVD
jgi:hypothetical protein